MAETVKYIAYISLDFLETVFNDAGLRGNEKEQREYIDWMMKDVNDFIKSGDDAALKSWKWCDNEGVEHHAIELMPVWVSDEDALFVNAEQWEELKDIVKNGGVRAQISYYGEGGLVEQFERRKNTRRTEQ